jgi:hypothetical protein
MARLDFRGGWTPPPPFEFSPAFRVKAEKAIGKPFTERAFRDLEQACNNFILARIKAPTAAQVGPTREVLTKWASHFTPLNRLLEREDINTMAAWMNLARQSDERLIPRMPGRGQLQADIQAMAILAQRELVDLSSRYPDARGREHNNDLRMWIRAIAKIVERASGSIRSTNGRRLDTGFCKLIELLMSELPVEVHLMSKEAVLRIAREALRSSE